MLTATGIGSLPFRSVDKARALLARFELPFLPELPNVEKDDLLLRRPFAGLLEADDEPRVKRGADLDAPPLLGPGVALLEATSATAGGSAGREGPPMVKVQLAGPCVLGAWVRGASGPLEPARILARIETVARALLERLRGRRVTFFFDEPGLGPDVKPLAAAIERIRALGAHRVGVHDCGPGFRHALAARPDILSFDLAFFARDAAIDEHLARGGALAVGAVSTTAPFDREKALGALAALPADVRARSLVTPACGTALLDEATAERVHEQALELAQFVSMPKR